MADPVQNDGVNGNVDFKAHARDYTRMIALLKYGAIAAFVITIIVMIIIAD